MNSESWNSLLSSWEISRLLALRGLRFFLEQHLISNSAGHPQCKPCGDQPAWMLISPSILNEAPSVGIQQPGHMAVVQVQDGHCTLEAPALWVMSTTMGDRRSLGGSNSLHEQSPWCSTCTGWSGMSELRRAPCRTRCRPAAPAAMPEPYRRQGC